MWDNEHWGGGFGPFPPEEDQVKEKDEQFGQWWGCTPWEGPDEDFPDVKNVAGTIAFLETVHEQPFFAVLGIWRPHTPFTAPKRYFELYDPALIQVPPPGWKKEDLADVPGPGVELAEVFGERYRLSGESTPEMWRKFLHAYFACTSFADDSCGRVLEALDASRYAENTVVVFWSDNGYHCGEKNHWEKNTLWEQATLAPMAIRMPGKKNAGSRCRRTVSSLDLFPTLVDLCGLEPPRQQLEGRSLRPLLEDPTAPWERPALTTYGEGYGTVRDERYRLIVYPDGSAELYDHDRDPDEHENLADQPEYASVRAALAERLPKEYATSMGGRLG
jgi:arylsulfatase A-like enzyme